MTWTLRDLKEQARAVRAYWRSPPPGKHLSAEGATLLSLVEALPADAVLVPRAVLDALEHSFDCAEMKAGNGAGPCDCVMRDVDALLGRDS